MRSGISSIWASGSFSSSQRVTHSSSSPTAPTCRTEGLGPAGLRGAEAAGQPLTRGPFGPPTPPTPRPAPPSGGPSVPTTGSGGFSHQLSVRAWAYLAPGTQTKGSGRDLPSCPSSLWTGDHLAEKTCPAPRGLSGWESLQRVQSRFPHRASCFQPDPFCPNARRRRHRWLGLWKFLCSGPRCCPGN